MAGTLNELGKVIEQVGKDKGIDRELLISALEEALVMVAKKKYGLSRDVEAKFNEDVGEVELFQIVTVVDQVKDPNKELSLLEAKTYSAEVEVGDVMGVKMDSTLLSRIAAQTAKQVIVQKIRDAEREIIFNEFQHRKGEIITGLIRRVDRGAVIVDLGKTEGYMPQKEQIPGENYMPGDRVQAYLADVQLTPKGPRIILSRACPEYLIALFKNEVPEIREGLVTIKNAAREPGIRAKIAVTSRDPDVDSLGACVGVRGSRVQNIIQELKGERIDVVPYNEDITRFVCDALGKNTEVQKVVIDEEKKAIDVIVSDSHLSLAIGKRGQNVRLASQLTGWKLDIISETVMAKKTLDSKNQLMIIPGVTDTLAMALFQSGFYSVPDVANCDEDALSTVPGFDSTKSSDVIKKAQEIVSSGAYDKYLKDQADAAARKAEESEKSQSEGEGAEKSAEGGAAGLESKLRAEVAAREKSKGQGN
jgi:N utilization substance protein A